MVLISYCEMVSDYVKGKSKVSNVTNWLSWKEALKSAKQEGKPILILIQNPDCEGCKIFKEEFSSSPKARELGSKFVLASINSSDAPKTMKEDGNYVPRVYFASSEGKVMTVFNELGNPKRKYNYANIRSLLVSMNNVIKLQDPKQ